MSLELREQIGREEFDYSTLMLALSGYASPRARVTSLLRSGLIVRVKKGLYVFGDGERKGPYSRELLGNLMYGPSVVSLDYALSYYGLIPERVEAVTSVTTNRAKRFDTPVGLFIYRPTPSLSIGVERIGEGSTHFLMACPERALADRIRADRRSGIRTVTELASYLFEDLRMDEVELGKLDAGLLHELAEALRSNKVRLCASLAASMGGRR